MLAALKAGKVEGDQIISLMGEPDQVADETGRGRAAAEACATEPNFSALVKEHHERLFRFIYRFTQNREDAEDLTQDTFVKAYKNLHRYDERHAFAAWLFTIGRRTVYNHYRSKKRMEVLEETDFVDTSDTPDDQAENADQSDSVWESVKRLKAPYREVLVLKYREDLSVKEIAKILNKSETNVKILLFRARNQLKKFHSR